MENSLEALENKDLTTIDNENTDVGETIKVIRVKSYQSINESNLMVIPFVSFQRQKVETIERSWERNGVKRGIKIVGSAESGCPTVLEMDVLLGLFRILLKNVGFEYQYNQNTNKVNLPRTINFTYAELAKELGYSKYGGSNKKKLERSVKTLLETTIYSDFALRDIDEGDYIADFNGEESFRILTNYKSYSYTRERKKGNVVGSAKLVKEKQSVDIDEFFFKNICNNYFKIYDYEKYMKLTKGISKKLMLLLSQWSHGYKKYLKYETLYENIGLDVETKKDQYYYNRLIKDALDELVTVGFMEEYEIEVSEGVHFIFNAKKLMMSKNKHKYNTQEEVIQRLQELGFTINEWTKYYRLDNEDYVRALLRYVDDKIEKGEVKKAKEYTEKGLKYENYDVREYLI